MRLDTAILVGLLPIVGLCGEPTLPPANSAPATLRPLQSPARLSAGTYKFAGRCTKMAALAQDLTSDCGAYLGIIAKDPERPLFIIPLRDGKSAWEYQVTSPGVLSDDGKVMTYTSISMIDLAKSVGASRIYSGAGECVNSVRIGDPLLRCTMWRDPKRSEVIREVIFEGNGNWIFDRRTR